MGHEAVHDAPASPPPDVPARWRGRRAPPPPVRVPAGMPCLRMGYCGISWDHLGVNEPPGRVPPAPRPTDLDGPLTGRGLKEWLRLAGAARPTGVPEGRRRTAIRSPDPRRKRRKQTPRRVPMHSHGGLAMSLSRSRPDVISRAHVARVPRGRAPRNPCVAPRKRLRACEEGSIHAEPRLALESLFAREETRVSLNKLAWRPECSRL